MKKLSSLNINPSIAGEWIEEKLYLVDVKKNIFYLLSEDASRFLCVLHQQSWEAADEEYFKNFGARFSESKIEELIKEEILTPAATTTAMLEHSPEFQFAGSISTQAILEKGEIEARIVATGTNTFYPTTF